MIPKNTILILQSTTQNFNELTSTNEWTQGNESLIKGSLIETNEHSMWRLWFKAKCLRKDMKIMSCQINKLFTTECLMMCWKKTMEIGKRNKFDDRKTKYTTSSKNSSRMPRLWACSWNLNTKFDQKRSNIWVHYPFRKIIMYLKIKIPFNHLIKLA